MYLVHKVGCRYHCNEGSDYFNCSSSSSPSELGQGRLGSEVGGSGGSDKEVHWGCVLFHFIPFQMKFNF